MTPMIDVVFLLIIFFLVSSHLAQRENRIQVELPAARGGQAEVPDAAPRLTLTLQEDGRIWLGGRQLLAPEQLTERLQAQLEHHGTLLELRIRCDRRLPYRHVEPVLASAARAGLWNVSFAVVRAAGRCTVRVPSSYSHSSERAEAAMTPMIDVVFLLLIFFVWTSSFQAIEAVLPSQLTSAGDPGRGSDLPQEDFERIVVRLVYLRQHGAMAAEWPAGRGAGGPGTTPRPAGRHQGGSARRDRAGRGGPVRRCD